MGELYTCKDVAERYGVQIITVFRCTDRYGCGKSSGG